jgi:hypothetical protein
MVGLKRFGLDQENRDKRAEDSGVDRRWHWRRSSDWRGNTLHGHVDLYWHCGGRRDGRCCGQAVKI